MTMLSTGAGMDSSADDDVQRMTTAVEVGVEDWWMEGGMGIIDVSETTIVHVGESLLHLFVFTNSGSEAVEAALKKATRAEHHNYEGCVPRRTFGAIALAKSKIVDADG